MTSVWLTIAALALITAGYKLVGPLLLGGRELRPALTSVVGLLASALLAALVIVETFGKGRALTVDARVAGLLAAGLLIWRKAPMIAVVIGAALAAAVVRLI